MNEFNEIVGVATKIMMVGAGLWAAWGGYKFFSSLNDHNSAETKQGLLTMAGGVGMFLISGVIKGVISYL